MATDEKNTEKTQETELTESQLDAVAGGRAKWCDDCGDYKSGKHPEH